MRNIWSRWAVFGEGLVGGEGLIDGGEGLMISGLDSEGLWLGGFIYQGDL